MYFYELRWCKDISILSGDIEVNEEVIPIETQTLSASYVNITTFILPNSFIDKGWLTFNVIDHNGFPIISNMIDIHKNGKVEISDCNVPTANIAQESWTLSGRRLKHVVRWR